jgi:hypothetical protein
MPKRAGAPKLERIFELQLCLFGLPELFVSVLVFENRKHASGEMVNNVTVIRPNAGIIRVKHDLDGGFWRNQDGVAPGAGDLFPIKANLTSRIFPAQNHRLLRERLWTAERIKLRLPFDRHFSRRTLRELTAVRNRERPRGRERFETSAVGKKLAEYRGGRYGPILA